MQDALKSALVSYQAGRLEEALATLRTLPPDISNSEPVLALSGNIYAKLGKKTKAGNAFLALALRAGADQAAYARLAVTLLRADGRDDDVAANASGLLNAVGKDTTLCFDILTACEAAGVLDIAAASVERLDLSDPHHAMLGLRLLRASGRHAEVIPFLDNVLAFRPDDGLFNAERFSQALKDCEFDIAEECKAAILEGGNIRGANMQAAEALHRRLMWTDDPARLIQPGLETHTVWQQSGGREPPPRRAISPAGEKLRIAYLSNDFSAHATMTLLKQVLLEHDSERFDFGLFCYTHPENAKRQAEWPSALRERIITVYDLSVDEVVARISAWKADILVDLKGFTGGARPAIVRLSDAPVKVGWLGYPGSAPWIDLDYCIADPVVAPPGSERFYEEKLCRLPESYQPNDAVGRPRPSGAQRAEHGLPDKAFVFASFNGAIKLNRETIAVWAHLLKETPNSVLWCLRPTEPARTNIARAFEANGVALERLIFAEPLGYDAHINRVPLADLALDTFPCGGHTTTSDMLWAGVPVLTRAGQNFASRVSASLLSAIGLPELVTSNADDYLSLGLKLGKEHDLLEGYRRRIAENRFMAPLFDGERIARHLEAAFGLMAARVREGLMPGHIDVPPLPPRQSPFAVSA